MVAIRFNLFFKRPRSFFNLIILRSPSSPRCPCPPVSFKETPPPSSILFCAAPLHLLKSKGWPWWLDLLQSVGNAPDHGTHHLAPLSITIARPADWSSRISTYTTSGLITLPIAFSHGSSGHRFVLLYASPFHARLQSQERLNSSFCCKPRYLNTIVLSQNRIITLFFQ